MKTQGEPLSARRPLVALAALAAVAILITGCCSIFCKPRPDEPFLGLQLEDSGGRPVDEIEIGETLNVGLTGLRPDASYRVELADERGELVSFYRRTTDRRGSLAPSPLWYHSGVVGCGRLNGLDPEGEEVGDDRRIERPGYRFRTFEEARRALAGRDFTLTLRDVERQVVARRRLPLISDLAVKRPRVYFSDAEGCLMNSFEARQEPVYLTAHNLPPGATVQLFLVPNRYGWRRGATLREVREQFRGQSHLVTLDEGQTSVTQLVWAAEEVLVGAYDAVVRINDEARSARLRANDLITYVQDTGTLIQALSFTPPWTPGDFDIAGRLDQNYGYPYFEFHDTFEVGESMWGAVDPGIIPSSHPGGTYAAFYVIDHGTASGGLTDVTPGPPEIMPVKSSCINVNMNEIWASPTQGEYDIVVDFGATPAATAAAWTSDGTFNAGTDFIDRATTVGAYVVDDPSDTGPFAVLSYSYQPATTSSSDPLRTNVVSYFNTPSGSVSETMDKAPLRGVGHYPVGSGPFPLVLIVHGNHDPTHASHTGYDYLTSLLASHGMIAISVDENFLNYASGEMDARAIILLRHLQRWRTWNGTSGHTFHNKVDLTRIGLAGHSRGGEAITVANLFNSTLHNAGDPDHDFDFDLEALYAIAPVDGQIGTSYSGTPVVVNDADYFIMHGSHDGDVATFGGQKTYDRAFPNAATAGGAKGLLFVQGANHNYWNQEWVHANDAVYITSSLTQIGGAAQRDIAEVYMSGFFQWSLQDEEALGALLTGDVRFSGLPSGVTLVHQYSDPDRVDLNNYEEDHVATTGSFTGVTNAGSGLSPFLDQDITGGFTLSPCGASSPYYLWHQTSGLVAGWNSSSASYTISLPAAIGTMVDTHPYLSLRIGQIFESPAALNPAGANKDLSIQLQLGSTSAHKLKVSNFDTLPYPAQTTWTRYCTGDVTKSVPKTVRIPLRSFIVNQTSWQLADISQVQIKFDVSGTGLVVIDDVQLSK